MMYEDFHKFEGVKRGTHPINLDPKYLWDAHNIRFENKEDGSLLSIVSEVLPEEVTSITFPEGKYVGHCILGSYLTVFILGDTEDYICRVHKSDINSFSNITLFLGKLNFDYKHPILALGVYENDLILKVYWTDGINQPRYINIINTKLRTKSSDVDFIPELTLADSFEIKEGKANGLFFQGVILYAITYYNKYGTETSIIYISPLLYIHFQDRGAKADEKVQCSFDIKIIKGDNSDLDKFDYIRVYSIHRTSLDAVPTVRLVMDILIIDDKTEYQVTDNGFIGELVEDSILLYIGGEEILAGCLEAKDNTLFLGDITHKRMESFKEYKNLENLNNIRKLIEWNNTISLTKVNDDGKNHWYGVPGSMFDLPGFKYQEWYRCGFLLQYKNGKWSEPIFLKDTLLNNTPPFTKELLVLGTLSITFSSDIVNDFYKAGFRRIRTCVVFPSVSERSIIAQGMIAPTVFSVLGRNSGVPYTLSSWFFRPKLPQYNDSTNNNILYIHNKSLFTDDKEALSYHGEIQGANHHEYSDTINAEDFQSTFFVDENIVTMHSPDIEWNDSLATLEYKGVFFRVLGVACLDAVFGMAEVLTSVALINPKSSGLNVSKASVTTNSNLTTNGGLVSVGTYLDSPVYDDAEHTYNKDLTLAFPIYPWHRSGSLNNDSPGATERARSAVLLKKKLGNLKYFKYNLCNVNNDSFLELRYNNIGEPIYISTDDSQLNKIRVPHLLRECSYESNIDTAIIHLGKYYPILPVNADRYKEDNYIKETNDPIRMKYKSTPHLVFSLGNNNGSPWVDILPVTSNAESSLANTRFALPSWDTALTGDTLGNNVVTLIDDNLKYIIYYIDPNRPFPVVSEGGLAYCPTNAGSAYQSYRRFWRVDETLNRYVEEGLTGKIITIGKGTLVIGFPKLNPQIQLPMYTENGSYNIIDITRYFKVTNANTSNSDNCIDYIWADDNTTLYFRVHGEGTNLTFELVLYSSTSSNIGTSKEFLIRQPVLSGVNTGNSPYMIIGELVRTGLPTFGGDTEEALQLNLWIPSSNSELLIEDTELVVPFSYGDTWISRYDCLKTYPYTTEDENLIIDIGSFLVESRINIDGRCDKNRGNLFIINMSPINFNLFNSVYNLLDNFFPYRIYDKDYYDLTHWSNLITWSLEKHPALYVDSWTLITLANIQLVDGDMGTLNSIVNYNDYLFYFLDKAFGRILFNSRVLIPASDGVPIEISNGYKVDGVLVISNSVGCLDKWTIVKSPLALYFVDLYTKTLYGYGESLQDLSTIYGIKYWFKQESLDNIYKWNIKTGLRLGYDTINQDVYFATGGTLKSNTLCLSEKLGASTGTYDYIGVPPFSWEDATMSIKDIDNKLLLFIHNKKGTSTGNHSISFISNENPNYTKIFDTIEFRGDIITNNLAKNNKLPFNKIEVSNEYLSGEDLFNKASLKKKFRVWRGNIPRVSDTYKGNRNTYARARLRNPWSKITLSIPDSLGTSLLVLHDMSVKYTI